MHARSVHSDPRLGRNFATKKALEKFKLDGKEQDIRVPLGEEVSKASIAKILDISRCALHFIETRKIVPKRTRHPHPIYRFV